MAADVVILGGGPAGWSAAIELARRGVSTRVLPGEERRDAGYGETLPAAARPALDHLGVWDRFLRSDAGRPVFLNRSAWGGDAPQDRAAIFDPRGHGWRLDRRRFDGLLAEAAGAAGVESVDGVCAVTRRRLEKGWELETSAGTRLRCRFVLDATGRAAWFARGEGARRVHDDRLIGFFTTARPSPVVNDDPSTVVEAVRDGWWYSGLQSDGSVALAFFSDADLAVAREARSSAGRERLLAQTRLTAARIAGLGASGEIRNAPARSGILDRVAGPGWLAVGDAAATFDPLSSYGITAALTGGLEAAAAAETSLRTGDEAAPQAYERLLQARYAAYRELRGAYYRMERRWPEAPFWVRRIAV